MSDDARGAYHAAKKFKEMNLNDATNIAGVLCFENSFAAQLTRSYPCHFTLITRTASCSRQLS
jgi:hypothetical protein